MKESARAANHPRRIISASRPSVRFVLKGEIIKTLSRQELTRAMGGVVDSDGVTQCTQTMACGE